MSGSIHLHPKHGVAPVMTACCVCHADIGIALTGIKFDKFFPNAPEPSSTLRIMDGPCEKCEELIKGGATAFVSPDGRSFMLSKEGAERNNIPTGKLFKVDNKWMDANQPPST